MTGVLPMAGNPGPTVRTSLQEAKSEVQARYGRAVSAGSHWPRHCRRRSDVATDDILTKSIPSATSTVRIASIHPPLRKGRRVKQVVPPHGRQTDDEIRANPALRGIAGRQWTG